MDDEITWSDSGQGGQGGVPAQRVEMETRMLVDHAGESTLCPTGRVVADVRTFSAALPGQIGQRLSGEAPA